MIWQICGVLAIVAFGTHLYLDLKYYSELLSKKTARFGLVSILMAIFAVGIVVVINTIALEYDTKWDFTKHQLNSLSEQSTKVLKGLKDEVKLIAFISPMQQPEFEKIFGKYTYCSHKLKTQYVDADKDPLLAEKYNVKQYPLIVVESEARTARVEHITDPNDPKMEEKITNAIISATKGDKKKIYFVVGHGEHLLSEGQGEGYSELKESLEAGRYKVEELPLLEKTAVPSDAEVVIVGGPKSDFAENETHALDEYLKTGGKLLFMVDPTSSPKLQPFLAKYGVNWVPAKAIVETNPLVQLSGGNALTPIVNNYDSSHEITRSMKPQTPTIFPIVAPVEKADKLPAGIQATNLFSTSRMSLVGELHGNKLNADQKTARRGPLPISVAVWGKIEDKKPVEVPPKKPEDKKEGPAKEFRMVVTGNSTFVANQILTRNFNSDLFQNMLSWLAHEEDLISIRPRPADSSEFTITEERSRVINLASVVFAPIGLFMAGIGVWFSRRRK